MIHASKIGRYAACPGAYLLEQSAPKRPPGDAAKLGTAAAKLVEICLKEGTQPIQYVGQEVTPGEVVDVEMAGHIGMYVDYCRVIAAQGGASVEYRMVDELNQISGTPDFMSFDGETLTIVDLKYGFGWVEAVGNWQLRAYVALWAHVTGFKYTPKKIKLVIVQPRANHPDGPIREWEIDGPELRAIYNTVANVAAAALIPNPFCTAGPHCRYCPAIVGCNTNKRSVSECMGIACEATYQEMNGAGLSKELDTLQYCQQMIGHRVTAAEEYAAGHIAAGHSVPGYTYDSVMGPLKWLSDDPLRTAGGYDIAAPPTAITPKQAIDRGIMPENLVLMLAKREPGAPKLKKVPMKKYENIIKSAGKAEI